MATSVMRCLVLLPPQTIYSRRRLRSRSPYLVRRLHQYYEAVRLHVSVHRWITVSDLPSASSRAVFGVGPEVSSIELLLIHTYRRGFLHIGALAPLKMGAARSSLRFCLWYSRDRLPVRLPPSARREHRSIAMGSHSVDSPSLRCSGAFSGIIVFWLSFGIKKNMGLLNLFIDDIIKS